MIPLLEVYTSLICSLQTYTVIRKTMIEFTLARHPTIFKLDFSYQQKMVQTNLSVASIIQFILSNGTVFQRIVNSWKKFSALQKAQIQIWIKASLVQKNHSILELLTIHNFAVSFDDLIENSNLKSKDEKLFLNKNVSGAPATQRFYRYSRESGLELLPGKYKTTNSLAFDYERNILYHLDGCTQELIAFKVSKTGSICKKTTRLR